MMGKQFFAVCVWGLYIVLSPLYILPQPGPQPADFIMGLGMVATLPFLLLNHRLKISPALLWGGLFIALTVVTNTVNGMFIHDKRFFLTALMMPYNFGVFLFTLHVFTHLKSVPIKKITYLAIFGVIIFQFIWLTLMGDDSGRHTGSFSNPNQLAYWTLLTGIMLVILKRDNPINGTDALLIAILFVFQGLALSKAGIITFTVFLLILFLFVSIKPPIKIMALICSVGCIFIGVFQIAAPTDNTFNVPVVDRMADRLGTFGKEYDDSLSGRHYDRIYKHPEYLLFGAGEGGFKRFNPDTPIEMHSGLGTVLFSYGIVGFFLFVAFIYYTVRGIPRRYQLFLIPIFLYGLTHQNIRFTHFWIVLGMLHTINLPHKIKINEHS